MKRYLIISMMILLNRLLFSAIDTHLTLYSHNYDTPSAGNAQLIIDVEARSNDASSYYINAFQDAFQLDANLRAQSPSVSFSNQLFPDAGAGPAGYNTTEDYQSSDGRIRYVYGYKGGSWSQIGTSWTTVVRITITYTMTNNTSTISWYSGLPNYNVDDYNLIDRTGVEESIPSSLTDLSLPVQMSDMQAESTVEGVELNWSTASEVNSRGFYVWRASDAQGDYEKITTSLITSEGNNSAGSEYSFTDQHIQFNGTYYYKIEQIDINGSSEMFGPIEVKAIFIPKEFGLSQNYPNPFNPSTTFNYDVPEISDVTIRVYSLLGKEVKVLYNKQQTPGRFPVTWDGTDETGQKLASGVYFLRMQAGSYTQMRKMTLIR